MSAEIKGHLVVLIGPSGSGKNTLKAHLMETFGDELCYPVSYTSREMRPGEREGETYYFIDRETFLAKRDAGKMLESVEYSGNLYGLPRAEVEDCNAPSGVALVDVELEGLRQILEHIPRDNVSIMYIDGGTWEGLRARIEKRAPMPSEELELRRKSFERVEREARPRADYIIRNEDGKVEEAYERIEAAMRDVLDKQDLRVRMRA